MRKFNFIIVGAGLTGLSAAYHLNGNYCVLEKRDRVGGLCLSEVIDGFTFDYAIHILYSKDEYVSKFIKEVLLKDNFNSQTRESWIYSKGTYTEYPFQAHTYGLPADVIKECVMGLIEAKYENKYSAGPKNFAEWVYRTFGEGIAKNFMIPYNRKQWAIDPKLMDYNWISERIPIPQIAEVLDGALREPNNKFGPNAEFWYPLEGGIEALPRGFLPYLRNIELDSEVTKIYLDKKEIKINNKEKMKYEKLISTIPLPDVINLLDKVPQEIEEAAGNLKYNTIYAVNLGINREALLDFHWVYYPEDDYTFHRISFPRNFSENNVPEGTSAITAEISASDYKPLCFESLIEDTIRDLKKVGVIKDDDEIIIKDVLTLCPAYVIYDLNHRKNVDLIHDFLKENDIIPCGRFGEWEYLNMDQSILTGKAIAENIR